MHSFFSWLDDYTDGIQTFVHHHAVLAPLLFLLIEEMGLPLPVPGDAIIAYVGYDLGKNGGATYWEAFIVAMLSVLVGSTVLFFLSRRYGQIVIRWLARFVFLKQSHLDRAEKMFERFGPWAIIFGRHIPGMRIPITIFAASSGVRYRTFILSTFVSTVAWIILYLKIGSRFGGDFANLFLRDTDLTFAVFAAIIVAVVALHLSGVWRERRREAGSSNNRHQR